MLSVSSIGRFVYKEVTPKDNIISSSSMVTFLMQLENLVNFLALLFSSQTILAMYQFRGRPGDVPSPERLLKVLNSVTSWEPSEDSQVTNTKIDDLMKKVFFRCNSPCFTHLLLFFPEKINIQKFSGTKLLNIFGTSAGRPSYMFFKFNSETY